MDNSAKRQRRAEKLEQLFDKCILILGHADDTNSVVFQLIDLAYKDTIYKCFNEGLRLDEKNSNSPKALVSLIHESFFASQLLAIRRLLDGGEDVQSLRRIFDLIFSNKELFTRDAFVTAKRNRIERRSHPELQGMEREFINQLFDSVSNKSANSRSENDTLHLPFLDAIKEYLDRPSLIHQYTDAFIAHALLKKKHKLNEFDLSQISLENIETLLETISWLSYTLSRYVGELILFEVPTVTFDKFEGWFNSVFSKNLEVELKNFWYEQANLLKSWEQNYWDIKTFYEAPLRKFKEKE
jgi:hypothetical protein